MGVTCQDGGCSIFGIACCKCFLLVGVGCGRYFTVMAARINGKEAG